jgi:hypothetical protein
MIISIDDELFQKVKQIVKGRNLSIYEQLEDIKPLDKVATDTTLATAREIKTKKVKQLIGRTIKELLSNGINPTKYKINKATGIAFVTLNKYYSDILEEVKSGK